MTMLKLICRYECFKTGGVTKQQLDQAKLALTNAGANLNKLILM
jgi:hypothetical protein